MKELLEYILKSIVNDPEAVRIDEQEGEGGLKIYYLELAPVDVGIVIGKQGRTIRAIRTLVRTKAIEENIHVRVELKNDRPMTTIEDSPLA